MSLNCYSPTKRRVASPKKHSSNRSPDEDKPYAALDETQRSHAYRYNIGNNFYREQVDRDDAAEAQRSNNVSEKSLPAEPETLSPPGTTVTTFMLQVNKPDVVQQQQALKLVPATDQESMPTDRALIEARNESKLLRMMMPKPETPPRASLQPFALEDDTPPNAPRLLPSRPMSHQRKVSVPESTKNIPSKSLQAEAGVRHKSTKSAFNVASVKGSSGVITTGGHNNFPAKGDIPIPAKAAKLLGSSTATETHGTSSKWSFNLHRRKMQRKRANTTSSLPEKMQELDQPDVTALPSAYSASNSAEPDRESSFEDTATRVTIDKPFGNKQRQLVREESDATLPPTPPAKDTPPHAKATMAIPAQESHPSLRGLGIDEAGKAGDVSSIDFCKEAVTNQKSESALYKHGVAEHVKLIEASPSMHSMQASIFGSPSCTMHPKGQTPSPDDLHSYDLRPDGLRSDGLTREGHLPQTVYSSNCYSPSVYSALSKTADLNEEGKKARSVKRTAALRTIVDSSPVHSDNAKLVGNYKTPDPHSDKRDASAESLPIVYRLSTGEFILNTEHRIAAADDGNLRAQLPRPPRDSSLNWQKRPPPGTRLSLIPSRIRQTLAISELSMTTSDRLADMSGNMRHDSTRPSSDGVAEDKHIVNDFTSSVNGANGTHVTSDSDIGRQAPAGAEHTFQRSIGLTPYLTQQLDDNHTPLSPGFNHPSAIPSPLAGPFHPAIHAGLPSYEQLLTHFHVLHYHVDDAFRTCREAQKGSQDEILGDNENRFNELRRAVDEYFADVRSHLNAIEHNVGRVTGETENLRNALDAHARSVDDQVYKPMRKLTNQNTELIKKVETLQERVVQLEKKFENGPPADGAGSSNNGQGPVHARSAMDGPSTSFARAWGAYDASRHMVPGQQQQDRQPSYTDVGGRYYNGTETAHRNYQDSYYGNGPYNNFIRRH